MTSAAPSPGRRSIGAVIADLHDEFPDLTLSKLRFLETEGLVEPERTSSGYRKYSDDDVERLRYVLRLQRDRFLPLREIRRLLDDLDRGLEPSEGSGPPRVPHVVLTGDGTPSADDLRRGSRVMRLTRDELLEAAGIDGALLGDIEAYGLIETRSDREWYDGIELTIARTVGEFASHGLEPRHLRAFRAAADREIGLFSQIVSSQHRRNDASAGGRADETLRTLLALSVQLHTLLVREGLSD